MECKITSTRSRRHGALLAEWVIAVGISTLVFASLAAFSVFTGRTFVTMENYVELGAQARWAADRMSQEIREAKRVTSFNPADPTRITLQAGATNVTFVYNPTLKTVERQYRGNTTVLLKGCESAQFAIFTRQATNATYEIFPTATVDNAKVVQITWNCSRTITGQKQNTEAMQSARVVIRNQGK